MGGPNYEDAIILSQRLVQDDVSTSIHIDGARGRTPVIDTKLGPEEITRYSADVSRGPLADLDERASSASAPRSSPATVLVGKVTPKGEPS
ncbi:hypothetical protein GCM10017687_70590 [Streptomyces echinatus]|uniref:hypothetical protein n=1 Tax=Streptomyces echinatus TaxID=67293 RepID=UPI0031F0C5F5